MRITAGTCEMRYQSSACWLRQRSAYPNARPPASEPNWSSVVSSVQSNHVGGGYHCSERSRARSDCLWVSQLRASE